MTLLTNIWHLCIKSHIMDDHPRPIGKLVVGRFRLNFNCYVIQVCVQCLIVTMVTRRSCYLHVLKCYSDYLCLESICLPCSCLIYSQIANFMGPTWGPPGPCRPQMGPMLAPWNLLSGFSVNGSQWFSLILRSTFAGNKPQSCGDVQQLGTITRVRGL